MPHAFSRFDMKLTSGVEFFQLVLACSCFWLAEPSCSSFSFSATLEAQPGCAIMPVLESSCWTAAVPCRSDINAYLVHLEVLWPWRKKAKGKAPVQCGATVCKSYRSDWSRDMSSARMQASKKLDPSTPTRQEVDHILEAEFFDICFMSQLFSMSAAFPEM